MTPQKYSTTGNPIIRHKFFSDPTALVFEDTFYLYTGHDEAPIGTEEYVMNDWFCSSDLMSWTEHPVPLKATDFTWASGDAYASKVIRRNETFFLVRGCNTCVNCRKSNWCSSLDQPDCPIPGWPGFNSDFAYDAATYRQ